MLVCSYGATAQFGSFQSLHAPFGARNAALGGRAVSLADGDLMQFVHNPAVLDSVEAGDVALQFSPYFAGIYSFSGAYQANFARLGKLAFGMTYLNYGTFTETADNGDELGSFQAADYLLMAGKSHQLGSFSLGASAKFAYSGLAGYGSALVLADLGGIYRSPVSDFTVGLVFKNIGVVINDYFSADSSVPFDVLLGASIKPQYMPFRFTLSAHNLVENDLYFRQENDFSTSRVVETADKIFRRINVGMEVLMHPNLQFLIGYSHLRRTELRLTDAAYGAGFSYGLLLTIRHIQMRYAHATYHAAGGTDFFTLQTNLSTFQKLF